MEELKEIATMKELKQKYTQEQLCRLCKLVGDDDDDPEEDKYSSDESDNSDHSCRAAKRTISEAFSDDDAHSDVEPKKKRHKSQPDKKEEIEKIKHLSQQIELNKKNKKADLQRISEDIKKAKLKFVKAKTKWKNIIKESETKIQHLISGLSEPHQDVYVCYGCYELNSDGYKSFCFECHHGLCDGCCTTCDGVFDRCYGAINNGGYRAFCPSCAEEFYHTKCGKVLCDICDEDHYKECKCG
eukprot:661292_1